VFSFLSLIIVTHSYQFFSLRISQKGDHWHPHVDDVTLRKYGHPLQALAHAILMTLSDNPPCGYRFPITAVDKISATRLLKLLTNGGDEDCVQALHQFTASILSGQEFSDNYNYTEYSKWHDVFECFLAVYCLNQDGNFKSPFDVTSIFAKIEYLCRGMTLYEGLSHLTDFGNNAYK